MSADDRVQPLTRSDFAFSGFDCAFPRIEARLNHLGITSGEPEIMTESNCLYVPATRQPVPYERDSGATPKFSGYRGGFLSAERDPLEWSFLKRGGNATVARPLADPSLFERDAFDEVDGEVIYLGWLFQHFGHFLVESLSRVWCLGELDKDLPIVFHSLGNGISSELIKELLERFGVSPGRLLMPRRATRFRKVLVPDLMHELHYRAHQQIAMPYRAVAEDILEFDGPGASDQPVYISRRLLRDDKRALIGEWELEEALQENGFVIARPETMTFQDQVRLFNRHRNVFAVEQSALNSVLFSLRAANIHCISTLEIPLGDFFLLPKVSGAQATFINASYEYHVSRPTSRQSVQILNLEGVFDYLHDKGFLPRKTRSALARRVPDLFAQYEEAFFYRRITSARKGSADLASAPELECAAENLNSWVVSAALSHYYATNDHKKCEFFARLFVQYLERETDISRLAKYQKDVANAAMSIVRACSPDTAKMIKTVTSRKLALEFLTITDEEENEGFRCSGIEV